MSFIKKVDLSKELKDAITHKETTGVFNEVIRLHYEKDYGSERISRILSIGHTTG
jgi:hypothetical protein